MNSPYEEGDPLTAKVVLLGEAPARTEMRLGRPFCGPSGYLLDELLGFAGISRRECYLTNVFEYPVSKREGSDLIYDSRAGSLLFSGKGGFTEEGLDFYNSCVERLRASKANVIVPMGNVALALTVGKKGILKWRGSILYSPEIGKKVVPTIHPAASLRGQYIYRYYITHDLRRVKEESLLPEVILPERELAIGPTYSEVLTYLDLLSTEPIVAFDVEILNHQVSCISFSHTPEYSMSIPFLDSGDYFSLEQETEIWRRIALILGDEKIEKINQNIIFDITILLQQNGIVTRGQVHCIMCGHSLLYPDFPMGLDFLCAFYTREPYYKDDGKIWSKPWVDIDLFWQYNAKDSCTALECWLVIKEELKEAGLWETYLRTVAMFPSLTYMMIKGIFVDREKLEVVKERVTRELEKKKEELDRVAEHPFNPLSPKQCIEYFYNTKGIKPYTSRKTGKPTTDDTAMARLLKRYNLPEAKLVQDIRGLSKLKGTYLEVVIDDDNYVRSSLNPRGTIFGRISSSQTIFGTGLNMQNLHPEFKEFLVVDPTNPT